MTAISLHIPFSYLFILFSFQIAVISLGSYLMIQEPLDLLFPSYVRPTLATDNKVNNEPRESVIIIHFMERILI